MEFSSFLASNPQVIPKRNLNGIKALENINQNRRNKNFV